MLPEDLREYRTSRTPAPPDRIGPVRQLVLQPTPFCNIDCRYCYLPDRLQRRFMSAQTAAHALRRVFDSGWFGEDVEVRWHAGEPLVVGREFYLRALAAMRPLVPAGVQVRHTVQTNGTLVDAAWCRLFRDEGFEVGLSIDGPADLHDRNRRTRSGKPTHAAAMQAVSLFHEHRLPFSVIAVLTLGSLDRAEELYEFFAALRATRVGFNVEEVEGVNVASSLNVPGLAGRLRGFLDRFHELARDGRVRCREFEEMRDAILAGVQDRQNWMTNPGSILCVAWNGDVSGFSPELQGLSHPRYGSFTFGNVHEQTLPEMLGSSSFLKIHDDIRLGVRACQSQCEYFSLCGGGAPSNKLSENGSFNSTATMYCGFRYKAVAEVVLSGLEADLHALNADAGAVAGKRADGF